MSVNRSRMRPSRVLRKLRSGEVAYCTKLNLMDARSAGIAAMSGFDCIWTDMEHVPNDWSSIEKQILAAKVHDVDTVVRVARGSYSDFIRPLEMDATAIMVPHVMNLIDAKSIIRSTKFYPLGLRAVDGGNADGAYCGIELLDYLEQANSERFNILQIEDVEALEHLEEIIELPGLDMIFFGPGDFSQSIGVPGEMNHPLLIETKERIAALANLHGKYAGTVGGLNNCKELIEQGYRFINIGADVIGLNQYYGSIMETLTGLNVAASSGVYAGPHSKAVVSSDKPSKDDLAVVSQDEVEL